MASSIGAVASEQFASGAHLPCQLRLDDVVAGRMSDRMADSVGSRTIGR